MKALAAIFVLVACGTAFAADELDPEKIREARALLESMHAERQMVAGAKVMADAMAKNFASQGPLVNQHVFQVLSEEIMAAVPSIAKDPGGILDSMAVFYASEFSLDELRQTRAYYETPAGQHMLEAQPKLVQVAFPKIIETMRARMPSICEKAKARLVAEKVENAGNMKCPVAST